MEIENRVRDRDGCRRRHRHRHRQDGRPAPRCARGDGGRRRRRRSPRRAGQSRDRRARPGLARFTTSLADLPATHGVRVNCVVPNWIGLDRAHAELAAMPAERRATAPPQLIPPGTVVSAVVDLLADEMMSGRVVVLEGGREPRLLEAT